MMWKWFKRNKQPSISELEARRARAAEAEKSSKRTAEKVEPTLRTLEVRKPRNGVYELVLDSISPPRGKANPS